MKTLRSFPFYIGRFAILLLSASLPGVVHAADVGGAASSRSAEVEGVKLHYLTAGHGPAVILLHGYTQTSLMWKPIFPLLAEKFTVIAPDLPGIGDSEIPADGLDMKTAAVRIHALAKSLGIEKARVVGHDIGLMVAYAYAAQFPTETEKLVVMDAFLPGVAGWENVYNNPGIWHFRFNGPTPEALVQGRERTSSSISGMTSPLTRRIRFRKLIGLLMRRPMRVQDECARAGHISSPSSRQPKTSRNFLRPS
jgi:pimeloyl-ACP methyl ester carboxylesterase